MRIYVDVICSFSKSGAVKPLYIIWDKCTIFSINRVLKVSPQKMDNTSRLEFICLIGKNERSIFLEGGKWYVEKLMLNKKAVA